MEHIRFERQSCRKSYRKSWRGISLTKTPRWIGFIVHRPANPLRMMTPGSMGNHRITFSDCMFRRWQIEADTFSDLSPERITLILGYKQARICACAHRNNDVQLGLPRSLCSKMREAKHSCDYGLSTHDIPLLRKTLKNYIAHDMSCCTAAFDLHYNYNPFRRKKQRENQNFYFTRLKLQERRFG